jgi:hypothetical protein
MKRYDMDRPHDAWMFDQRQRDEAVAAKRERIFRFGGLRRSSGQINGSSSVGDSRRVNNRERNERHEKLGPRLELFLLPFFFAYFAFFAVDHLRFTL